MCTKTQLKRITDEVSQGAKDILGDKLYKVILYGSYARGDYNSESDIDIMILANVKDEETHIIRKQIHKVTSRLGLDNDIMVSVSLKDKRFFYEHMPILPYYQNVVKDGVELYAD